jgi:hypothetical protein
MQNPDDPLAVETIEHRRHIEAADAKFRATLSQALRRGGETLQGCVGRHERLRNSHQRLFWVEAALDRPTTDRGHKRASLR